MGPCLLSLPEELVQGWKGSLGESLTFKSATKLGQELGEPRSVLGLGQASPRWAMSPGTKPACLPALSLPGPHGEEYGGTGTLGRWLAWPRACAGHPWHVLGPWGGTDAVPQDIPMMLEASSSGWRENAQSHGLVCLRDFLGGPHSPWVQTWGGCVPWDKGTDA